jgi:hypothetical protein
MTDTATGTGLAAAAGTLLTRELLTPAALDRP